MAFLPSISISTDDCKNLIFSETTGVYNSSTNPSGWGSPNPAVSDATAAILAITTPSGSTYTFNITSSSFPTNNINQQYLINYSNLGMSSGLVDGLYTIVYSVSIATGSPPLTIVYPTKLNTMIVCNLQCCIDRLLPDIDDWNCECNKDTKDKFLTAYTQLLKINHAIKCGDLDTASELVDLANKICKNINCSNCK